MKKIRKFLLLVVVIVSLILYYARYMEPNQLIVKSLMLKTEKDIKDFRVVFFADTHFGSHYDEDNIQKIVETINEQKADIVIFGGDLFDNYARDKDELDFDYLQGELSKIEAKGGKFAVFGNHDYGGGAVRIYEDFMTSCGFEVLVNESHILEEYNIKIVGYDDYLLGRKDSSLYKIEGNRFNIIVAHEPVISTLIESESDNFMFSAHTHGGQVSVPHFTKEILPEGSGQFWKGLYSQEEIGTETSIAMYTSSGIGLTRYPVRFFNVPEIIQVDFVKEDK